MLDSGGKVDGSTFNLLANQKDVDPHDASAAIREEKLPSQGPLGEPAETTFAVYETGRALTYLPDPVAHEVAARIFDHPNIADSEVITIPLYPAGDWPEAQAFAIEVYDDPTEKPYFDQSTRRLRVPLPKGIRAKVRLSMKLDLVALSRMGVFALMSDADKSAQQARALDGQHWMLTPWHEVEVVHAVQRPLMPPEIASVSIARDLAATSARPKITATCSVDTTDRLDLFAEWHEPTDDPVQPDSAAGPADRQRRDAAFQVKITDPKSYALRLHGAKAGGYPDHTLSAQDVIEINAFKNPPKQPPVVPVKAHEFHDTRYRRIEYWFDGTTRYREYLPRTLLTTVDGNGQVVPTETHIKITGQRVVSWIPSSASPPTPRVLYVVPTFGWTRTLEPDGTRKSWRHGGGLRVYLDRPWCASGYGEMLAVVLPPAGFMGDPDTVPDGHPYKKYVTQWGNDPIWDSPFVAGIAPRREDFPLARNAPDPTGSWLPPQAPGTEGDQRPGPFPVRGLRPAGLAGLGEIEVAPHDVSYDADRRLWYCDIEIKAGASYFPFVRLALARYQPTSVTGAHLSNVVLADFMTLAVDRWLSVTPSDDPRTRRVAVFGVRPWESSGHHEADEAPAMSVIDITGAVHELRPAAMAESTLVEVWVERLDERLGEDFGWRPVSGAIVSGSDSSESASTGSPIARTIVEGLIDLVTPWQTLWEGSVTLPSTPGRYRLVIGEYEEYLIDDEDPYDEVPTRKGRRLVFVEHVELG
jgi:hypothetical protein